MVLRRGACALVALSWCVSTARAETFATPEEVHLYKRDGTGLLITGGAVLQVGGGVILIGLLIQSFAGLGDSIAAGINGALGGEPLPPREPPNTGNDVMIAGGIVAGVGAALMILGGVKLGIGFSMTVAPQADGALAAIAFEL